MDIYTLLRDLHRRAARQRRIQYEHVRTKLQLLGIIGFFGFPAYWLIWTYIYPQPYENLTLRLLGAVAAIPFIIERWLPQKIKNMMPSYGIIFCTMALPTFFSYMTLMNGANIAWQTSFIASFIYLALVMDAIAFIISAIFGTIIGIISYLLVTGLGLPQGFINGWPVYLFVLSAGTIFNYAEALARADDRIQSARAVGGTIAHEMRTPLLGVRLDAEAVRERLAQLLAETKLDPAARSEADALLLAMRRIEGHGLFADSVMNMMLTNLSGPRQQAEDMRPVSMAVTVTDAMNRFPFRGEERRRVILVLEEDFMISASPVMLTQVIHNLLRNALRATAEAGRGEVVIRLENGRDDHHLIVRDTGIGIPEHRQVQLFRPFSTMWAGTAGVGLGLAFCKKAIEDIGGTITVTSLHGSFTQFRLSFPTGAGS